MEKLTAVAKLDRIHIVGEVSGSVIILKHTNGTSFRLRKRIAIIALAVHQSILVTCSAEAILWDTTKFKKLATFGADLCSGTITDQFLITCDDDRSVQIYKNGLNFSLQATLTIECNAHDVGMIDNDAVAVACDDGYFRFISLSSKTSL